MEWYGVIKKTIVLDFANEKEVMLFQCDWFVVPRVRLRAKAEGTVEMSMGLLILTPPSFAMQRSHTSWRIKQSKFDM